MGNSFRRLLLAKQQALRLGMCELGLPLGGPFS